MNKYFLLIKRFNLRYCHFEDDELMIVAAATENAAVALNHGKANDSKSQHPQFLMFEIHFCWISFSISR